MYTQKSKQEEGFFRQRGGQVGNDQDNVARLRSTLYISLLVCCWKLSSPDRRQDFSCFCAQILKCMMIFSFPVCIVHMATNWAPFVQGASEFSFHSLTSMNYSISSPF